jgi:putative redox protein
MGQTLSVQIEQIGEATASATTRSHRVIVDRPIAKGGEDRGPLGGEYVLIGLGGCFLSNLLAAIRARGASVFDVRVAVTGTIEGPPDHFAAFTMVVTAAHADGAPVARLIAIAARACVVTNTLRLAAPVSIEFNGEMIENLI